MNGAKETGINNRTYYFFDDIIKIKSLDPNETKIDKKSYKNYSYLPYWIDDCQRL